MPYTNTSDLPDSVRNVLPKHAQDIYIASFNSAYEEYKSKDKRRDPEESPEEVAHKVAWAAVKKEYHKDKNDKWVPK